jgi:hypothetical protein
MIINRVTLTGADDKTSIGELKKLQKKYPYVEWGILIASNPGKSKQPTDKYIMELKDSGLKLSLHMCNEHAKGILTDGILDIKYDFFDRYQLNFNFNHTDHDLNHYSKLINKFKNKNFILQTNFSNELFIDKIIENNKTTNTHILYDSSGGRGVEIKQIKSPYKNIYTGYSGGINPDNIDDICKQITFHKKDDRVWIDIQTGARTNNEFDLEKVTKMLKIVDKHINKGFTL